jgi:hypothetical protein
LIRFGAIVSVVAVAIGLLAVGAVSGDLTLVYVSIGLAALALLMLIVGVVVWRDQLFAFGSAAAGAKAPRGADTRAGAGAGDPVEPGWPAEQVAGSRAGRSSGPVQSAPGQPQDWRDREPVGNRDRAPGREQARPGRDARPPREQARSGRQEREQARQNLEQARQDREPVPAPWTRSSREPRPPREPKPADRTVAERQIPAERAGRPSPDARPSPSANPAAAERVAAERAAERVAAERAAERVAAERAAAEPTRAEALQTAAASQPAANTGDAADDPTRLARRLHSAAELSRNVVPDAASPSRPDPSAAPRPAPYVREPSPAGPIQSPADRTANQPPGQYRSGPASADLPGAPAPAGRRFADPLTGPPPASAGSGRTRLQKEAEAAAGANFAGSAGQVSSSAASPDAATRAVPAPGAAGSSATQAAEAEAWPGGAGLAPPAAPSSIASSVADTASSGANGTSTSGGPGDAAPGAASAAASDEQVLVVPGIARYHKSGCILIRFLGEEDLSTMSRAAAEESGCVACRACRPDKADA